MVFWRKKKNIGEQERRAKEYELIHKPDEPDLLITDDDNPELDRDLIEHELEEKGSEIIDELDVTPVPEHTPVLDYEEEKELQDNPAEGGWFSRMTRGLSKSSGRIGGGIAGIFTKKKLDSESLEDLEDLLISSDIGPETSAFLVGELAKVKFDKGVEPEEVRKALAESVSGILEPVAKALEIKSPGDGKPFVVLVCGVNGVGKTTTIGKMAYNYNLKEHKSVMIAAADTFRAAAVEQLEIWAQRAHCGFVKKDIGSDAAAVAFEAYEKACNQGSEILMIDTAGRLHNKANLMAELEKIVRVLKKRDESAPHAVLLVLDATTGQNAHNQVEVFKKAVDVTGLVITKLDGSARGGVVVSLAGKFGIPIHAVGVGEKIEDLSPFTAREFANALMGVDT